MKEVIVESLHGFIVPIDGITLDPLNSKIHSDTNVDMLVGSLTRFGQTKPVVLDRDGICRAGHGLLEAAGKLGWKRIAAIRLDIGDEEAMAYGLMDNRASDVALGSEWNWDVITARLDVMDEEFKALLKVDFGSMIRDGLGDVGDISDLLADIVKDEQRVKCTCGKCGFVFGVKGKK